MADVQLPMAMRRQGRTRMQVPYLLAVVKDQAHAKQTQHVPYVLAESHEREDIMRTSIWAGGLSLMCAKRMQMCSCCFQSITRQKPSKWHSGSRSLMRARIPSEQASGPGGCVSCARGYDVNNRRGSCPLLLAPPGSSWLSSLCRSLPPSFPLSPTTTETELLGACRSPWRRPESAVSLTGARK